MNETGMSSIIKEDFSRNGFSIKEGIYTAGELDKISHTIDSANTGGPAFRKTGDLFAIRRFLRELPELKGLIFTERLRSIITSTFGGDYFVVKSIYFDKPGQSNWFVAYHQDITISVREKQPAEGFGPWTVKGEQYAVQPPLAILENNFTIRIHLDDTDEYNGALRVIPGSHRKGVYRPETINRQEEKEVTCKVPRGGIMLMHPLLMHASSRTINNARRRVLHIEFSNCGLPGGLQWAEQEYFHSGKDDPLSAADNFSRTLGDA